MDRPKFLTIDANVACKWYLNEPLAEAARRVAESDQLFVAPEHMLAEVADVLRVRYLAREITGAQIDEIASALPTLFILVPTRMIFKRAVEIACELRHSVYDTLYLVVAERWQAPLVTADSKLVRMIRGTIYESLALPLETFAAPQ